MDYEKQISEILDLSSYPDYETLKKNFSKKAEFPLPDGRKVNLDTYKVIGLTMDQMDYLEQKYSDKAAELQKLRDAFISLLKSNLRSVSVDNPYFSKLVGAVSLSMALIIEGKPYDLGKMLEYLDINDVVGLYSSLSDRLRPIVEKRFGIIREVSVGEIRYNIQNVELLNDLNFSLFTNYALTSHISRFYDNEQDLNNFMDEFKHLLVGKVMFDVIVYSLHKENKITNSEANKIFEEANSFLIDSLYLERDGREVAKDLFSLLNRISAGRNVSAAIHKWKQEVVDKIVDSYVKKGVDLSGLGEEKKKSLCLMFTVEELIEDREGAENVLENIDNILKSLQPKFASYGSPIYHIYVDDPEAVEALSEISSSMFASKGYSERESVEIYRRFLFGLLRDSYMHSMTPEEVSKSFKKFFNYLPTKEEVEKSIKKDINLISPVGKKVSASVVLSVPENVAARAVLMAQNRISEDVYNRQVSEAKASRGSPSETITVEAKKEVEVVYYYDGKKKVKKEKLFDLTPANMPSLTPFNDNYYDKITLYVKLKGEEKQLVLDSAERGGERLTLPISFYLSHVLNDIYARGITFHYLSSSKSKQYLASYMAINYSGRGDKESKEMIKNLTNSMLSFEEFSTMDSVLSSDFNETELGRRAAMYANAFVDSVRMVENKEFTPEQLERLWVSAYTSFVSSVLYEFNLDNFFLGKNIKKDPGMITYDNLIEISGKLDEFLRNGYELEINENFLYNRDGKGLRIGSGVNFVGFKGGTSLWVVKKDGSKELLAYTTSSGIEIVNPKTKLLNSDNLVLLYHRGKKDLSSVASDQDRLWEDGRFYGHSSALRFLTHNYHMLTEKTLYEVGYNTSSVMVSKITGTNFENPVVQPPVSPGLHLPIVPNLIKFAEAPTVSIMSTETIHVPGGKTLTLNFPLEEQQANPPGWNDFVDVCKKLGIEDPSSITNRKSSSNTWIKNLANYLNKNGVPDLYKLMLDNIDELQGLNPGGRDTLHKNLNGLMVVFRKLDSGKYQVEIFGPDNRRYLTGEVTVASKEDLEKNLEKSLITHFRPVAGINVPSSLSLSYGPMRTTVGSYATIYRNTQTGEFAYGISPSVFFSASFYSGETYNLSTFGGVVFNPQYFPLFYNNTFRYSYTPMFGLNLNKVVVNGNKYDVKAYLTTGASVPRVIDTQNLRDINLQPIVGGGLSLRYGPVVVKGGFDMVGNTTSRKAGIGFTSDKKNVDVGFYVRQVSNAGGGTITIPEVELGTENLLAKYLKFTGKALKKLWGWTFGNWFGKKKEVEREELKRQQEVSEGQLKQGVK